MNGPTLDTAINGLFDALSRCLDSESSQRVADFHIDPGLQARVDNLAERANAGTLDEDQRAEYDAFINATDFISVLKLKARRRLGRSVSSPNQ